MLTCHYFTDSIYISRDEKIRVSHFPNCYNVETYLLGHTEYVLKILLLSDELLLSIGGKFVCK